MNIPPAALNHVRRLLLAALLAGWLSVDAGGRAAFSADQPGADPSASAPEETPRSRSLPTDDRENKVQSAWLALIMFFGLIVGGALLLALVVTWGNRARRLARSPLPQIAKPDELWFLKPKRAAGPPAAAEPTLDGPSPPAGEK